MANRKEYEKKWRQEHNTPDWKKDRAAYAKRWRELNDTPERKQAKKAYMRKWYEENYTDERKQKAGEYQREYRSELKKVSPQLFRCRSLVNAAKHRSKKNNISFDLTSDYLMSIWPIDNCCPILHTPFTFSEHESSKCQSASLDKIIPSLGYVEGNVQIISFKANRIKNNATAAEILAVADYLRR